MSADMESKRELLFSKFQSNKSLLEKAKNIYELKQSTVAELRERWRILEQDKYEYYRNNLLKEKNSLELEKSSLTIIIEEKRNLLHILDLLRSMADIYYVAMDNCTQKKYSIALDRFNELFATIEIFRKDTAPMKLRIVDQLEESARFETQRLASVFEKRLNEIAKITHDQNKSVFRVDASTLLQFDLNATGDKSSKNFLKDIIRTAGKKCIEEYINFLQEITGNKLNLISKIQIHQNSLVVLKEPMRYLSLDKLAMLPDWDPSIFADHLEQMEVSLQYFKNVLQVQVFGKRGFAELDEENNHYIIDLYSKWEDLLVVYNIKACQPVRLLCPLEEESGLDSNISLFSVNGSFYKKLMDMENFIREIFSASKTPLPSRFADELELKNLCNLLNSQFDESVTYQGSLLLNSPKVISSEEFLDIPESFFTPEDIQLWMSNRIWLKMLEGVNQSNQIPDEMFSPLEKENCYVLLATILEDSKSDQRLLRLINRTSNNESPTQLSSSLALSPDSFQEILFVEFFESCSISNRIALFCSFLLDISNEYVKVFSTKNISTSKLVADEKILHRVISLVKSFVVLYDTHITKKIAMRCDPSGSTEDMESQLLNDVAHYYADSIFFSTTLLINVTFALSHLCNNTKALEILLNGIVPMASDLRRNAYKLLFGSVLQQRIKPRILGFLRHDILPKFVDLTFYEYPLLKSIEKLEKYVGMICKNLHGVVPDSFYFRFSISFLYETILNTFLEAIVRNEHTEDYNLTQSSRRIIVDILSRIIRKWPKDILLFGEKNLPCFDISFQDDLLPVLELEDPQSSDCIALVSYYSGWLTEIAAFIPSFTRVLHLLFCLESSGKIIETLIECQLKIPQSWRETGSLLSNKQLQRLIKMLCSENDYYLPNFSQERLHHYFELLNESDTDNDFDSN